MYEGKTVSVAIATYREKKSIRKIIDGFFATGFVDTMVVVNNNAESGTDVEIRKTKAFKKGFVEIIYEKRQGYGFAYRKAILNSKGYYIIVTEADDSFSPKDLERFLVYAKDFDVVLGTRTSQIGSLSGSLGMGIFRKFANVIEAKSIEILFNSVALTDVGCTYKLFKRKALDKIGLVWSNAGSAIFNTELVLLVVILRLKFVEIPITYNKRVGVSSIVGKNYQAIKWAIFIQIYIFFFWIYSKINSQKYRQ